MSFLPSATTRSFAANRDRVKNRAALIALMEPVVQAQDTEWWVETMSKANVPAGPVNTMDQVFAMDQIAARAMRIEMQHSLTDTPVHLVGSPLKLSQTPVSYRHAPPVAGQHTEDILAEMLGMGTDAIRALRDAGVIG
jgi:crotonobetainyl-CoA:carnitine CoA-transferase CaiB-like acyl-CoA transferase